LDTDLEVSSAEDWTEEEEQDADCVFCIGRLSEGRTVEVWIRCAKYCRWSHTICDFMEKDFVFETGQGESRFVLPCISIFFNSVNNNSAFCVNYSLPDVRKSLLVDMKLLRKRIRDRFFS